MARKNETTEATIILKPTRNGSLAALIEAESKRKFADKYTKNLRHKVDGKSIRWKEDEWLEAKKHHDICVDLANLSHTHNFPYAALVYFAIGGDAHKKAVFEKGYKEINLDKAETILKWLAKFAKYNKNPKFYTSDKIVHAFSKFYDTFSKKDKDFNTAMRAFPKMPAPEYKASCFKTMQQFYELFFKPFITCVEVDETTNEVASIETIPNPLAE